MFLNKKTMRMINNSFSFLFFKNYYYICIVKLIKNIFMEKQIIFLCGIPASGKSTYAKYFENINQCVILSRDKIRREFNETLSEKEVSVVFNKRLSESLMNEQITTIIIDNTNVKALYIQNIISLCIFSKPDCRFYIKIFDTPFDECVRRNSNRMGIECVPHDVMKHMNINFKAFMLNLNNFSKEYNITII